MASTSYLTRVRMRAPRGRAHSIVRDPDVQTAVFPVHGSTKQLTCVPLHTGSTEPTGSATQVHPSQWRP